MIARTKDRQRVVIRDLPVFDRRVKLVWSTRHFSCPEPDCPEKTWCERSDEFPSRQVLSARAGRECTRARRRGGPLGGIARPLARCRLGNGDGGGPPPRHTRVEDPDRVGVVTSLGIDETAFLRANAEHPTNYVTGFVDLERPILVAMVEGNRAIGINRWLARQDDAFLAAVRTAACDLHEGYRAGLHPYLDSARQVADPSTSSRPPTAASTPCAAGCRTSSSAIAGAETIPSIGSAGYSSPGQSG